MKAYITNGTVAFLKKIVEKYSQLEIKLMHNGQGGLAYYEHRTKQVFQSGREYEIIINSGELHDSGYVVMNNIPVAEDSQPVFEDQFKKRKNTVDTMPGFQAFRFLKPTRGNTYIVLTQWASFADFENWKNSKEFADAHKAQVAKQPAHFSEKPFISKYHMYEEDEDIQ